ncbi:gamma-glutamyl-gamma-aminobutyrate hydrolase family protein [Nocardia miyunensis]|uniref:gamma-glutamyl-gamma-aminobutyrate hydrolase family protein n=1 Tax=Nocardia miyunensis TaxID=282684 RepID=UPI0014710D06
MIQRMDARFASREIDFYFSDYAACVRRADGIPAYLPYEAGTAEAIRRFDGLIVTGGQDIHPGRWGGDQSVIPADADPRYNSSAHDTSRDAYEAALICAAIDERIPVLGVCRGHQMLNVALGGRLVDDLPPSELSHYSADAAPTDGESDHVVTFAPGSTLYGVYGPQARVNSWHHQAVDTCGADLVVTARARDGVVEAIEIPGREVVGVQWHPEWQSTPDPLFEWLMRAAAASRRNKARIDETTHQFAR